jgi:hypothetical protein
MFSSRYGRNSLNIIYTGFDFSGLIKYDETAKHVECMRETRNAYESRNLKERDYLEDTVVDVRVT